MPLISVVIPLFNKEKFIDRAIQSVIKQTMKDFELIVVDDGSSDQSANVVRQISDSRIRIIQQQNAGVSAARNCGIREAKADLIAFLDADDEWQDTFLEKIIHLRKTYPEAGVYATAYEIRSPHEKLMVYSLPGINPTQQKHILTRQYFSLAISSSVAPVNASSVCIPQSVFLHVGLFAVGEGRGEDLDMWGRIALYYPVAIDLTISSIYWIDDKNSICRTTKLEKNSLFVRTCKIEMSSGKIIPNTISGLQEYLVFLELNTAKHAILNGESKLARRILWNTKATLSNIHKKLWWMCWALMPVAIVRIAQKIKHNLRV